jgi:hypothetical protein
MVDTAASAYFTAHNEPYLTDLKRLINTSKKFSARRNDIAHGIVQPFAQSKGLTPVTYALSPSRHATRRKRLEYNIANSSLDTMEYAPYSLMEARPDVSL